MRGYRTVSTVLLLCLLALDYAAAQCECTLTYANRRKRDKETDSRVEESVADCTRNNTDYLWSATDPRFNLTTALVNCTSNYTSIAEFVVLGRLYSIAWHNFTSGYNGNNDTKVWARNCNVTSCYPGWVSLLEYLQSDYINVLSFKLNQISKQMKYPIGIFRQSADRSYNYSSYNVKNNPATICSCTTTTGYSYSIRFSVAAGDLPTYYYNSSYLSGRLMVTDIELAIDNFTSYTFSHLYIQSNFDEWEQRNNSGISVFNITLYFKSYHDPNWNTSMSGINDKLSFLTVLQLKHVNRNLTVTQPPIATECCSYIAGQKDTCNHLTTTQIDTTIIASTLSIAGLSTTAYMNQSTLPPLVPNVTQATSPTNATAMANLTNSTTVGNSLQTTGSNLSHASQSPINVPMVTNASHTVQPQTNTVPTTAGSSNGNITSFPTTIALNSTVQNSDHFTNGTFTKTDPTTLTNPTQITVPTTRNIINSTFTPFDEDPFFKAVVPVVTKVYNDRILLKRIADGNVASLTQQAAFYTITIPAVLGIILATSFCVVICQIDWIGRPVQSKNIA